MKRSNEERERERCSFIVNTVCFCYDCFANTLVRDVNGDLVEGECEYFIVSNSLWKSVAGDAQFLCVGCFENRLGRALGLAGFWRDHQWPVLR